MKQLKFGGNGAVVTRGGK